MLSFKNGDVAEQYSQGQSLLGNEVSQASFKRGQVALLAKKSSNYMREDDDDYFHEGSSSRA